jgi:hypothetical protein
MLLDRIDENLFEFYDFAASAAGRVISRHSAYSYVDLRPSPWTNAVYRLDFSADKNLPSALPDGIRAETIPNKVRMGPTSRPADVEARLLAAGFTVERIATGMTLDVRKRNRFKRPPNFTLAFLDSPKDYLDFAQIVVVELFGKDAEMAPAFASLLNSMKGEKVFGLLGKARGLPASAAYAFIDGAGVGGVYFVATDNRMRGLGYGRATVSVALDELARSSVRFAILHATDIGKPVYEHLGFIGACRLPLFSIP